jgi:hypothetical protein
MFYLEQTAAPLRRLLLVRHQRPTVIIALVCALIKVIHRHIHGRACIGALRSLQTRRADGDRLIHSTMLDSRRHSWFYLQSRKISLAHDDGTTKCDTHTIWHTNHNTTSMGIRGLATYLKWKTPEIRRPVQWKGERWGIDCSCFMYRARATGLSHITVLACLIARMRNAGIQPVVVFDGRPPAIKADVVESRRVVREAAHKEMAEIRTELEAGTYTEVKRAELECRVATLQRKAPQVTNADKDDLKKFLYAAGVQFVTAIGEADDVLAYLCRIQYITAVVSADMDMLARGVPSLIIPETADATVLTEIRLGNLLTVLRVTYDQFVMACTLMGSDYTGKHWRSIEPRIAFEVVRSGGPTITDASGTMLVDAAACLRGADTTWEEIVSERQRAKWLIGIPAREPENLMILGTKYAWPTDWINAMTAS